MDLYEAIFHRRSVREYSSKPLPPDRLDRVHELIRARKRLRPGIPSEVVLVRDGGRLQDKLSGFVADYGKIHAPHYLIVSSKDEEDHLTDIGYSMERVVLGMTNLGIGTCWIGKGFRDEELRDIVELPGGQAVRILIAFGVPSSGSELERIDDPKRKGLDHFLIDGSEAEDNPFTEQMIEALRRAPSAINGQPWRVKLAGSELHLYIELRSKITRMLVSKMLTMNRIDGGIGLSHLEIAGEHLEDEVEVDKTDDPPENGYEYVGTLSLD